MEKYGFKGYLKDFLNIRALPANLLSLSRLAAPFVIPPIALSGNLPLLLGVSAGFMLTDFADGKVARALNGQTKLGERLDQVTDKVCSIGLLIGLIPSMPLMLAPLALETAIAVINAKTLKKNGKPKSTLSGKIKMWPLSIMMVAGYGALVTGSGPICSLMQTIAYTALAASVGLEAINIKEYGKMLKETSKKQESITINKESNDNIKTMNKEKTYANTLDNIDKCTNIDALKQAKALLNNNTITKPKVKIKKR